MELRALAHTQRRVFFQRHFGIFWRCLDGRREVSRTNPIFDRAKLEWFNTQYLQKPPVEEILPFVEAELKRAGLWKEAWAGAEKEWFARTVDLIRPRTRLLHDFSGWARAFFADDFDYEPEAR